MAKDAYYFPHDSNAKDDPKSVLLIEQLGLEGYGIYWVLVETLRDQPEYKYPLALIPALARRYNTTAEKMKTVVMQYGLFQIENDEFFCSQSLKKRMLTLEKKRLSQREKALKRWSNNAAALPQECHGNAEVMPVKESKEKESKVKESKVSKSVRFTPPSLNDLNAYISEQGYAIDAQRFLDYYDSNGWMVGRNKMKDWKAAVRNWSRGGSQHAGTQKPMGGSFADVAGDW